MRDQRLQIEDVVRHIDDATLGRLDVPEFQRKFVWSPEKTKKFLDSLWRGYPVGVLLLWESAYKSPKTALGLQSQKQWIVDGQQRITSLALLFGKKPYWWENASEWNQHLEKYDVLVDIGKDKESLEFGLPNPVRRKSPEWISVRMILTSDNLSQLAREITNNIGNGDFASVHEKLQTIKKIADFPIYEIIIDHELEDVAEIFSRLNTAGTKIKESDVIIALVASKQQGWVRDKFDQFLKDLADKGLELDPSIVIRTLGIIGTSGMARLRDIPGEFWDASEKFDESWQATKEAITFVVRNLMNYGILSSELLPAYNVLIPMFALRAKFHDEFDFKKALYCFLLATRDGRYSGSAITVLDQDSKLVYSSDSFDEAIQKLLAPLRVSTQFSKDDYLKEYADEFLRLILYLTVFERQAKDWIYQDIRIGYDRSINQLNEGFRPEWHHFFPKKVLRDRFDEAKINALANIAVLNEKANRTFTSKEPKIYLTKYEVQTDRLIEQLVPSDESFWEIDRYEEFLERRASDLAEASNSFMGKLRGAYSIL